MWRTSKGITLFELLISMAVSLILTTLVISVYLVSNQLFTGEVSRSDIFWEGSRGADTLSKEIREGLEITSAEAGRLTLWWKDLNANGSKEAGEIITYSLSGESLMRKFGSDLRGVASLISRLSFSYDSPLTPKLVTITITTSSQGKTTTLETKARLRNE
jgi:hypothetical protein